MGAEAGMGGEAGMGAEQATRAGLAPGVGEDPERRRAHPRPGCTVRHRQRRRTEAGRAATGGRGAPRPPGGHQPGTPAGCLTVTLIRLKKLVVATHRMIEASWRSSKW